MAKGKKHKLGRPPEIVNRRARHDYDIRRTLEVGIKLVGTEVKSVRMGRVSLKEGYVRVGDRDASTLWLYGVHIGEYDHAGVAFQHRTTRERLLLAHKREIRELARETEVRGVTIVPLKMYFKDGVAKVQIGVGVGKRRQDKRENVRKREAQRDIERALARDRDRR